MTPIVITVLLLSVASVSPVRSSLQTHNKQFSKESGTFVKIEKANANVISTAHLIHGDIMVNTDNDDGILRNAVPCTRAGCKWPKTGRNVKIPYEISNVFTRKQKRTIEKALREFKEGEHTTCIRFVKKTENDTNFISFISAATGCWSYLGRQVYGQQISLQQNGCVFKDIVQHEVLHALGFHHEHVRSDRDDNVIINFQNIQPGVERNFQIADTNNLDTPYDFDSVMHYGKNDFSKNGQPTIVARNSSVTSFGTATEMSANDYARVNKLYEC
ncbi:high choriolytic enzyme 1-like [Vanacampus margaritifer]